MIEVVEVRIVVPLDGIFLHTLVGIVPVLPEGEIFMTLTDSPKLFELGLSDVGVSVAHLTNLESK